MKGSKILLFAGAAFVALVSCSKVQEFSQDMEHALKRSGGLSPVHPVSQDEIDKAIYVQGSAIVRFSEDQVRAIESGSMDPLKEFGLELGFESMERLFPEAGEYEQRTREAGLHTYYIVNFDKDIPLSKACTVISAANGVENFEKRNIMKIDKTNDTYWSYLWEYTSSKYSIHAEEAWQYSTGDPAVKVCVVDEGIQLTHEDLQWNCGDVHYNFVNKNTTIVAGEHGSHVAGTIAAVGNNGKGIAGIAGGDYSKGNKGITLMSAQVFQGNSSASSFQNAIKWGADNGAVISQNSWGNNYDFNGDGVLSDSEKQYALSDKISSSMAAAIDYFVKNAGCDANGNQKPDSPMKGGVVCFAAGNDGLVNGVPANYASNISVGATTSSGSLAYYSNYGDWVSICAPGSNIISCVPSSSYVRMDGTSMACPHVSGACALLVSYFGGQGFTNDMLKDILLGGAKSGLINSSSKAMGPYLDILGSITYGESKYGGNHAPVISAVNIEGSLSFSQKEKVSKTFSVSDEDGDEITVTPTIEGPATIVATSTKNVYSFNLDCTSVAASAFNKTYNVSIAATDAKGAQATHKFTYTIVKNNPPTISASALTGKIMFREGAILSKSFIVSDPEGDEIMDVIEKSSVTGPAVIRKLSGTAGTYEFVVDGRSVQASDVEKVFEVTIVAQEKNDPESKSEHKFTYYLKKNHAPEVSTDYPSDDSGVFSFRQHEYVSIPFSITDEDGDRVSVEYRNEPATAPGVFQGMTNSFTLDCQKVRDFSEMTGIITAMDDFGGNTEYKFKYRVIETKAPVAAENIPDRVLPCVGVKKDVDLTEIFTDPNKDALKYDVVCSPLGSVAMNVYGNKLTLSMSRVGVANITVTASKKDIPGGDVYRASATFDVICREASYDFDYYPNPVRDILHIRPGSESDASMDIRITSAAGNVVYNESGVAGSLSSPVMVDMSKCAAGSYSLYVKMNGKEYSKTVVKLPR